MFVGTIIGYVIVFLVGVGVGVLLLALFAGGTK